MRKKLAKVLVLISKPKLCIELLKMGVTGYLYYSGWVNSFNKKQPVDINSQPVPWLSMPFNAFIEDRLTKNMSIFEFGCGNSTLYYASRVNKVTSVEHDKEWFDLIRKQIPGNVTIIFESLENDTSYSRTPANLQQQFDVIIVDGRDRVDCIYQSVNSLSKDGVLILDNSNREKYNDGILFLLARGFKKIDFWGLASSYGHQTCTTLFYRNLNCFNV